ncbi:MAG: 3-deoxy-manno-octulosonate cytidylyltransferase [Gammaproteobacteria bacterium]|nr:3-deoxy-manno-octulosonate cytidylyltransferase [Gammaproteobacteria bacterium]
MTASFTVIIPSRFGATRLPGKPLLDIGGKPLVQHAWESASASAARHVYVATDHTLIADRCKSFGAEYRMTSELHQSGTDRVAEVVEQLRFSDEAVIVNVQGDEVGVPAKIINQVAEILLRDPQKSMATLCVPFASEQEARDPNKVKVKFNPDGRALSFSREFSPDPHQDPAWGYRHIGLYAYRAGFLRRFTRMTPTESELRERLEQLRAIDNGFPIYVEVACAVPGPGSIDTPEDLERVAAALSLAVFPTSPGR